jgi:hypothetical protein
MTQATQEWMRLPSKGYDPLFGCSRSWYYNEIAAGRIRSSVLRKRGCLKGIRLIHVESVRRLIEANAEGGA